VLRYIGHRLLLAIPTLAIITVIAFLIIRMIPGDPAEAMAPIEAPQEVVEAIREKLKLDRPLHVQYFEWMRRVLVGDLGISIKNSFPVSLLVGTRLPVTLAVATGAMILGVVTALLIGILAAIARTVWIRKACDFVLAATYALPNFWLALMLILTISMRARLLPASGYVPFNEDLGQALSYLILPWITLATKQTAIIGRYIKTGLMEQLRADYTTTARAKGLTERAVVFKHALRNTMIPVVTITGLQLGFFFSGAIIVETIFNLPGMGRLTIDSLTRRDYPTLQVIFLIVGTGFVLINLLVDLIYSAIDPRIRYE